LQKREFSALSIPHFEQRTRKPPAQTILIRISVGRRELRKTTAENESQDYFKHSFLI
jgi:hypothetical protein